MEDTGFNCIMSDCKRLGPIGISAGKYYNNKKLSLKHNQQTQKQRHKYLIIGWCLGTRNREVFQGIN